MVLGHAPLAGASLAREWTQWAYDEFVTARRSWSHLRVQSGLSVAASRTLTVGVTAASATVTGLFVAADVGRAFRVGTSPYYTITAVSVGVSATLDRVYLEATDAAATATVFDGYA